MASSRERRLVNAIVAWFIFCTLAEMLINGFTETSNRAIAWTFWVFTWFMRGSQLLFTLGCARQVRRFFESSDLASALPPLAPPPCNVTTVFFPGNGGDLTQLAGYVGQRGFQLTNRLPIKHFGGGTELLYNPWLGKNSDGMDASPYDAIPLPPTAGWVQCFARPLLSLVYGLVKGVQGCAPALRAPWRINLAQDGDVKHALCSVRDAMEARPKDRIVLFGTSRGAAVALCVIAKLTRAERQRVALVVLEGVFDSVENVIYDRFEKDMSCQCAAKTARWALRTFTEYRADAPTPLDAARQLSAEVRDNGKAACVPPVAVITSECDTVVYPARSHAIYEALKGGATHDLPVHQLVLKKSTHPGYATDDIRDRLDYHIFMTDLYTRYLSLE